MPTPTNLERSPSSTSSALEPASTGLCACVARATGCDVRLTEVILHSRAASIQRRQQIEPERVLVELSLELEYCARVFSGSAQTEEPVFDELIQFTASRFGHLGVAEIRDAFRLAVAGELGKIDLRAYFGTFTVAMLGEVLRAYAQYRRRVIGEAMRLEQQQALEAAERQRKADWDGEAWELRRVAALTALPQPDLDRVTALDFDVLERRGLLVLSREEKWTLFERAGVQLQAELQASAHRQKPGDQLALRSMLQRVQAGQADATFYARQVSYAKRLAAVEWIKGQQSNGSDDN